MDRHRQLDKETDRQRGRESKMTRCKTGSMAGVPNGSKWTVVSNGRELIIRLVDRLSGADDKRIMVTATLSTFLSQIDTADTLKKTVHSLYSLGSYCLIHVEIPSVN